ncbi:MAG: hypothetical protein ACYSR6_07880, partial [Planctomycetota bacterium]
MATQNPATGARLYLASYSDLYPAHGGDQIMRYGYYTNYYSIAEVPYAETWLTLAGGRKNWKDSGVRALTLFFYGLPTNDANDTE